MIKKLILTIIILNFVVLMFSQANEDELFKTDYEKKSAKKAMILSAIFPGAGEFYADRTAITTYIFPVLEIGLWAGFFYYNAEGKSIEDDYKKYATKEKIGEYENEMHIEVENNTTGEIFYEKDIEPGDPIYRYERWRQYMSQENLKYHSNNTFYDNHFRLDETNTQHFYEDIGKYDKYIFGWADWFDIYANPVSSGSGTYKYYWDWVNNKWEGMETGLYEDPEGSGNFINLDTLYVQSEYYNSNYITAAGKYSGMRAEYIQMRKDAEDNYDKADLFSFGIVANHILSVIDAIRVTHNRNLAALSKNEFQIQFTPLYVQNEIAPAILLQKRF